MTSFESDYNNGAHPAILQQLLDTNDQQSASYGYDTWSQQARQKIRAACQCPDAEIYFLVGGTQANATVIDALLPSYGAVVSVETAHINVHESGAVEASGHKVITLPSHQGRMAANDLRLYLQNFHDDPTWEHMAYPGMVYITFPTELGTIYQASEIAAIHDVCQQFSIPLFIDGARLGYGLAASGCDITLPFIAILEVLRWEHSVARLSYFPVVPHPTSSPSLNDMVHYSLRADLLGCSSMHFSPMTFISASLAMQ